MTFAKIKEAFGWKPLRGCPGRFVLRSKETVQSPLELLDPEVRIQSFQVAAAPDEVLIAELPDGGLICYRHPDASIVHTLNTPEGFRRKIAQLGIIFLPTEAP